MLRARRLGAYASLGGPMLFACLALAAPASGGPDGPRSEPQLGIVWVDLAGISAALTDAATLRVRDLLAPARVRVFGGRAVPGIGGPSPGFRIVLMGTRPRGGSSLVAGAVNKVARREMEQATAWVYPEAIATELSLDLARARFWTVLERQAFCRALAVVVTHEVAHALMGSEHEPVGLMSARLGRRQLLDPGLGVDPDLRPSLRSAVAAFEAAARY